MKLSQNTVIAGSLSLALLSLGTGVAVASIPAGNGTITACYKKPVPGHGTPLNIIDPEAGGTCANGNTAVTWSQQGPPGPQGNPGPSTAGPAGLDLIAYVNYVTFNDDSGYTNSGTLTNGDNGFTTSWNSAGEGAHSNIHVFCPPERPVAVSNGFSAGGIQSGNDTIVAEIPEPGNGSSPGQAYYEIKQVTHQDELIKIWVICGR
jgi:hypothetical protein